jgi:integrase
MASIKKEGRFYYIYFRDSGRQIHLSLKTSSKKIAENIKIQIENEIAAGQFNLQNYSPHLQIHLHEFIKEAIQYSRVNKATSTVEREEGILYNFHNYFGNVSLLKIDIRKIEEYKQHLKNERNLSANSINIELRHLSAAFSLAVKYKYIKQNYFKDVNKVKTPKKKPIFLSKKQIKMLLVYTENRAIYPYILTSVSTGARLGEVANITWTNIDLKHRTIKLFGKGAKERLVPIPKHLLEYLSKQNNKNGYLIKGSRNQKQVSSNFRKSADDISLNKFKFHNLRDTYASHLVQKGINLKIIQELLGHESIQTTLIYAHLSPSDKFQAIKVIDKVVI